MSSSEDPLLGDQGTSTGVSPLTLSVILQGNLQYTNEHNQLSLCFSFCLSTLFPYIVYNVSQILLKDILLLFAGHVLVSSSTLLFYLLFP